MKINISHKNIVNYSQFKGVATFIELLLIIFLSVIPTNVLSQEKISFGKIKKELLGKEVYIYGEKYRGSYKDSLSEDVLMEWDIVPENNNEENKYGLNNNLPYSYKGSKGIVISIVIADTFLNSKSTTNAFGDVIVDDNIENPYLTITIKLIDGTIIRCNTFYPSEINEIFQLVSKVDKVKNYIRANIDSIIGKFIYKTYRGCLYSPQTNIDIITDSTRIPTSDIEFIGYGQLKPISIKRTKYIEQEDAIILELQFKDGKKAITLIKNINNKFSYQEKLNPKNYYDNIIIKGGFLEKLLSGAGFLTKIPDFLTKREIEAIKNQSIFVGMSVSAMWLSWGYDYKTNDFGNNGEQYIYNNTDFVYVKKGKIINWQSLRN